MLFGFPKGDLRPQMQHVPRLTPAPLGAPIWEFLPPLFFVLVRSVAHVAAPGLSAVVFGFELDVCVVSHWPLIPCWILSSSVSRSFGPLILCTGT